LLFSRAAEGLGGTPLLDEALVAGLPAEQAGG
jgi:hypothetical protein